MWLVKIDDTIFPLGPAEFTETINDGDEKVTLLNDGEIVIQKTQKLKTLNMSLTLPGKEYPFAYYPNGFQNPNVYVQKLRALKEEKKPFLLMLTKKEGDRSLGRDYKKKVVLSDVSFTESADNGVDYEVSITFSGYRSYGTKTVKFQKKTNSKKTNKKTTKKRDSSTSSKSKGSTNYTVKKGDTLRGIAKKKLGKTSRWQEIYKTNKSVIEKEAKKRGRKSSSNGHWIYPGTKLKIPKK